MYLFLLQLYQRKSKIFWFSVCCFVCVLGWCIYGSITMWMPKFTHDVLSRTPYINDNFIIYIKLNDTHIKIAEKDDKEKLVWLRKNYIGTPIYHCGNTLRLLGFVSRIEPDNNSYRFYLSISQNYHPNNRKPAVAENKPAVADNKPNAAENTETEDKKPETEDGPYLDYSSTEFVFLDSSQSTLMPILQWMINKAKTDNLSGALTDLQEKNQVHIETIFTISLERLKQKFQKQEIWKNLQNDTELRTKIIQATTKQMVQIPWENFWQDLKQQPAIKALPAHIQKELNIESLGAKIMQDSIEQVYRELLGRKTTPDTEGIWKKIILAWNYVVHREKLEGTAKIAVSDSAEKTLHKELLQLDILKIIYSKQGQEALEAVLDTINKNNIPQLLAEKSKKIFEDPEIWKYLETKYGSDAQAIKDELISISQDNQIHQELNKIGEGLKSFLGTWLKKIILNESGKGPNPFLARLIQEMLFPKDNNKGAEAQIICFVNQNTVSHLTSNKTIQNRPYRVVSWKKAFQKQEKQQK